MAQLVASVSCVVLGGVAEVVGSNLAGGKIFTAFIYNIYIGYIQYMFKIICQLN